jgi:hypothetical protein
MIADQERHSEVVVVLPNRKWPLAIRWCQVTLHQGLDQRLLRNVYRWKGFSWELEVEAESVNKDGSIGIAEGQQQVSSVEFEM